MMTRVFCNSGSRKENTVVRVIVAAVAVFATQEERTVQ